MDENSQELKENILKAAIPKREYKGVSNMLITFLGVGISIYYLLFLSGILTRLGIHILSVPHEALIFGVINTLVLFRYPAGKRAKMDRLPWYDIVLILMNLFACGYVFFFYETIILTHWQLAEFSIVDLSAGFLLILIILETTRRTIGWGMVCVVLFLLFHTLFCNYFPGFLHGRGNSLADVIAFQYMTSEGLWGVALNIVCLIVIIFIIFGRFLTATGAGEFFTNLAFSLFGHVRGGPAKVAVVASGFMGMLTGSTAANIASTGIITIPMMKRIGYQPHFAAAVETVASNGGQLMPPVMGAVAFIMAEILGISYIEICYAALFPALFCFFAVFMMVDFQAVKRGIKGLPREELPAFGQVLKEGWHYFIPLVMLLYLLVVAGYPPETSALYALLVLFLLSLMKKKTRMGPKQIIDALRNGAEGLMSIMPAVAAAGIIIGCVSLTGVAYTLSGVLVQISGGNVFILLVLAAISSFILGMGMTSIPCYLIVVIMVAPALEEMGIPIIAAHLFVFYYGLLSFVTPPVAIGAYIGASIAGSDPWKTGWAAARLAIVKYIVPFAFVYNPALLLKGTLGEIILAVITCTIGVVALSAGMVGYALKETGWTGRISFIVGGSILFIFTSWVGILIGIAFIIAPLPWQIAEMKGLRHRR